MNDPFRVGLLAFAICEQRMNVQSLYYDKFIQSTMVYFVTKICIMSILFYSFLIFLQIKLLRVRTDPARSSTQVVRLLRFCFCQSSIRCSLKGSKNNCLVYHVRQFSCDLDLLHSKQAQTKFFVSSVPPAHRGTTWSKVKCSLDPQ